MTGIVAEKSPSSPARGAASAAASPCCWRRKARAWWSATSAPACKAPGSTPVRRRRPSTRSNKAGGQAIASTLSIAEPKNAEQIVKAALDAFGRVDILVNNAGILRDVIFHKMSWSDWSDVINVHLNGSFNMSRAVAGLFREQNSGAYVHMTSTSGLIGNFGQANYMAAKLGIMGLSRGIALDMARFNVRSNCIAPFAFTRMIESIPAQTEDEKRRLAAFREMTPEKIAPLAVYLASDAAAGISGQILSVRNNEIFLFNQPRPIRTIHRADGWTPAKARRAAQGRLRRLVHPAGALRRRVQLGPDLISSNAFCAQSGYVAGPMVSVPLE